MIEAALWTLMLIAILVFMANSDQLLYKSTLTQQKKWQFTYENRITY